MMFALLRLSSLRAWAAAIVSILTLIIGCTDRSATPTGVWGDYVDVGEVWPSSDVRCRVTFHNSTQSVIRVDELIASCECTDLQPSTFELAPGTSIDVVATLDLTHLAAGDDPTTTFSITIAPRLASNADFEFRPATITGHATSFWKAHDRRVTLNASNDDDSLSGENNPPLQFTLVSHYDILSANVTSEPPILDARAEVVDGATLRISAIPKSTVPIGFFESTLKVNAMSRRAGRPVPMVTVRVHGCKHGSAEATPGQLTFGPGSDGSTFEGEVVLLARDVNRGFAVENIETSHPSITVRFSHAIDQGAMVYIVKGTFMEAPQRASILFRLTDGLLPVEVRWICPVYDVH
jgi:hypothetical protein